LSGNTFMRVLTEGTRLADRYTLIRRLGRGGMAEIWLAADSRNDSRNNSRNDSRVALKFLHAELAGDDRRRELFHSEWRQASRLMHAHIVRSFEYHGEADGPYFALQYLDGPDIGELAGLPLELKLRPFGLLADALRYAHDKGVVHRDVKASNVLFDGRGAPYLIDFGVAQPAGAAALPGAGTPVTQSPQQRAGKSVEAADDIFALGVLMHELVTGAAPVDGRVSGQEAGGGKLPDSIGRLMASMLAADSAARPLAGEVRERLMEAGFPPAAVPLPSRRMAPVEPKEAVAVRSIRPTRGIQAPSVPGTAAPAAGSGVSPVAVGGALILLLLVFFGVVFLLPDAVDRSAPDTGQAAVTETEAVPDAPDETPPAADPDDADPAGTPGSEDPAPFGENVGPGGGSSAARIKAATDEALGDLLSRLERLRYRGIERWGGQEYLDAIDRYGAGDEAYLNKNYKAAGDHYRAATEMLDPFFDRIDDVFRRTLEDARAAFEAEDFREAIRLYDLAVTITPGNAEAARGLKRARSLEDVLALTERGLAFEKQLELDAARRALENALELDPAWEPAAKALERVRASLQQLRFEQRMTEGFDALAAGNHESARAAFNAAKAMRPESQQPVDGLLQVDQEVRLARIRSLEAAAAGQVDNEQWETAVETYREALSVDGDLQFAKDGLRQASERAALHRRLREYIEDPDSLSAPQTMQSATNLLLQLSRITPSGPRLNDQKEQLSRLLKRAATPLTVQLVSDSRTEVSIHRVGKLGTFENRELDLRPGSYVAVGSRPGYRDVRLEFRVAPEIDLKPIVVACEEPI
jgi:serine/threonine protein kinase